MSVQGEGQQPVQQPYQPYQAQAPQPAQQPAQQQGGPRVVTGSLAVIAVMVVIGLVVLAIGYFAVVSVFDVPWYVAVPLSLVAGAGVLLYEMTFSWKAWLVAALLVGVAAFAAFGWWFTDAMA